MTSNRCEQIERIFFEALLRPDGDERNAFLEKACTGEPDLRRDVDALLEEREWPDSFLDRPVPFGETTSYVDGASEVAEGQMIGRYKLLQQLGEGGFGAVFMAEQSSPVRRTVAIKLIKPGMDSKEIIARFEAERQALALMDHPNIAKVLDAGTTDAGRPYFVMDLVKGVSLTEYCDANKLSMPHRLKLFILVCRAVQHAHQKGIIHRDLKPANVMVTLHDGEPVPKVIDFGVSKALSQQLTEKTLFTRYGQLVGTPQYMSPEQAEFSGLDVDTRSDIYSLGVLLYELLTGRPPFPSDALCNAGIDGMRRMIREQEPAKPSTYLKTLDGLTATIVASHRSSKPDILQSSVTGDLDWIVMKALEKNRIRRYDTVGNLIDDIQRHLNDEPIIAGPPTLKYQLAKLVCRHRAAALVFAAIAASVLIALMATTIAWQVAVGLNEEIEAALEAAETERKATEAEKDNAQQSLKLVRELFQLAAPTAQRGKDATVHQMLDQFQQRLDADPPRNKMVEIEVRTLLGSSYKSFSLFDMAAKQFDRAEELGRQVYKKDDLEFAEFLLTLARAQEHVSGKEQYQHASRAGKLRSEARTICESLDPNGTLLVEIVCELGQTQLACTLADALSNDTRKRLRINPYRQMAESLIWSDQATKAKESLDKALELAQLRNEPSEIVLCELALSDIARYESYSNAVQHSDRAIQQLAQNVSADTIRRVLSHRIDLEFDRPDIDQVELRRVATDVKRRTMAAWPRLVNLPDGASLIGYVAGALMSAGAEDEAKELLNLLEPLAGDKRNIAYHYLALWLRRDGELKKTELYLSTHWDHSWPLHNPWSTICLARARFHARDYLRGIESLGNAADWMNEFGVKEKIPVQRTSAFIQFEKAIIQQRAGLDGARESFRDAANGFADLPSTEWGDQNPSIRLLAQLFGQVESDGQQQLVTEVQSVESKRPLTRSLRHAALGQWALQQGNLDLALDEFILAMQSRPGRFEQINMEWVNDEVVRILGERGDVERLERILVEDIERRDREVARNHPERAYVRIRLVEMLHANRRPLGGAKDLLAEASRIYGYHGEWIDEAEHQKLQALTVAVTNQSQENRED